MAIAFVAGTDLTNNGATTNSLTHAHVCGAGSNRMLVVAIETDVVNTGNDDLTAVTYDGVAMTLAVKVGAGANNNRYQYLYYILLDAAAITAGSHNVVITSTNNHYIIAVAAEYTGVKQSTQPDATGTNISTGGANELTSSLTTVADNCWVIFTSQNGSGASTFTAPLTGRIQGVAFGAPNIADSNAPVHPAGSYSMQTTDPVVPTVSILHAYASFLPESGGGGGGSTPTLSTITPASGYANATVNEKLIGVALAGTNMGGASPQVNVPAGFAASNLAVVGTTDATFDLQINSAKTPGAYNVTFQTADGTSGNVSFTVLDPAGGGTLSPDCRGGFDN